MVFKRYAHQLLLNLVWYHLKLAKNVIMYFISYMYVAEHGKMHRMPRVIESSRTEMVLMQYNIKTRLLRCG